MDKINNNEKVMEHEHILNKNFLSISNALNDITMATTLEDVLMRFCDFLVHYQKVDEAYISIYDKDSGAIEYYKVNRFLNEGIEKNILNKDTIAKRVILSNEELYLRDVLNSDLYHEVYGNESTEDIGGICSAYFIPLVVEEDTIGVVSFQSKKIDDYTSLDIELFRVISKIISFIIYNHKRNETVNDLYEDVLVTLESSLNGLYYVDIQTKQMIWSERAKTILNIKSDLNYEAFINKINYIDRRQYKNKITQSMEKNESYEILYRYHYDERTLIWVKERGAFRYDEEGRIIKRHATVIDVTKQIEQEHQLNKLAYRDVLTGMKNRNRYEKDTEYYEKSNIPFALFMLDINEFKKVNDTFGHHIGDRLLKLFSESLKEALQVYDVDLYRLSGDEFVILLPYVEERTITDKVVNTIIVKFKEPLKLDDKIFQIVLSIGISFYPGDSKDIKNTLKYADISMYRIKHHDFIHYSYFDQEYYKQFIEEQDIEHYIKESIQEKEINMIFQPIVDLKTNKIIGFESLLHKHKRFNTDQVFDVAGKSSLIVTLDHYILEVVFKMLSKHKAIIPQGVRFTINLSVKTLEYTNVYEYIKGLIDTYQVSGEMIGIEVTEKLLIRDDLNMNSMFKQLRELGITFYFDDFGMGFSSVRNLTFIDVDYIKIDRSLISMMATNKKCCALLKSMQQFANEVDMGVIYEGVEEEEQLNSIRALGGRYIQGYKISKPLTFLEAIELMNEYND
ncbi:sensor domain-containing phosphodiesterase [Haloplasma contractile]|nr:EAL domain-containing protein [Haloplasma contractile]